MILILFNVLIFVGLDGVSFVVIDFDIEILEVIEVMSDGEGLFIVFVYILYDIVCKLFDGVDVILEMSGGDLCIFLKVGWFNFLLLFLLLGDFFVMLLEVFEYRFMVFGFDFVCLIDKIWFVILIEEMCYYFNGIYLYVVDMDGCKMLWVVVIDGVCFVLFEIDLLEGVDGMLGVIVLCKIV